MESFIDELLGPRNSVLDYVVVLAVYGALFILMRHANATVELNFRRSFWILFFGWSVGVFVGNYVFYLIGIMSFLPWLNNFLHTFVWIGLCLGFLYAGAYRKPFWEQFALFAIFSLSVKWAEREITGHLGAGPLLLYPGQPCIRNWLESDGRALSAALSDRAQDRFKVRQGSRFTLNKS